MDTTPEAPFPSEANRQALRRHSYSELSERDKWRHHAYDYAFRRRFLKDFERSSPIDPFGDWFNEGYVEAAERMEWRKVCETKFPTCGHRWRKTGFVCCSACKSTIPDYRMVLE